MSPAMFWLIASKCMDEGDGQPYTWQARRHLLEKQSRLGPLSGCQVRPQRPQHFDRAGFLLSLAPCASTTFCTSSSCPPERFTVKTRWLRPKQTDNQLRGGDPDRDPTAVWHTSRMHPICANYLLSPLLRLPGTRPHDDPFYRPAQTNTCPALPVNLPKTSYGQFTQIEELDAALSSHALLLSPLPWAGLPFQRLLLVSGTVVGFWTNIGDL